MCMCIYNKKMFILGTILGIGVGCLTLLLLKVSPMTMHELKEWKSQNQKDRDAYV